MPGRGTPLLGWGIYPHYPAAVSSGTCNAEYSPLVAQKPKAIMSKKNNAPRPAGKKSDADTVVEDRGQSGSGKTAASQPLQGLDDEPKAARPARTNWKKHDKDRPM